MLHALKSAFFCRD